MREYFSPGIRSAQLDRKDRLLMWLLTAVYLVFALINLGTLRFPQNVWSAEAGGSGIIDLGGEHFVTSIWINANIGTGQLQFSDDSGNIYTYDQSYGEMFCWRPKSVDFCTRYIRLAVNAGQVSINEIAFFNENKELLPAAAVSGKESALVDEQSTVPETPTYYNGMYFDEIYHARTAYEFLHCMSVYEWTHPPLGKIIIAAGILLFGMTPFGWRVMPALFGALMLPVMFTLGKRLFRRRDFAFLSAALLSVDTMHFAQTRIATVDVFVVFFILLMYLFMADYIRADSAAEPLKKAYIPLGACGVSFGLGVAAKWTGLYAGAGLAVIFFTYLIRGFIRAKKEGATRRFWGRTWITILFCCAFFLLIPSAIYFVSYTPFYRYELSRRIWSEALTFKEKLEILVTQQKSMYSYHSGLTATHLCQSAWYEWPFAAKSVWFYYASDADRMSNISTFGNPAVWWVSAVGTIWLIIEAVCGRMKKEQRESRTAMWLLFAAVAANFLPWTLVPRCTFQYHYFPTLPFVILCALLLLAHLEEQGEIKPGAKWIWLAVSAVFFALLLPACSGIPMPLTYARFLEYVLPGGLLFHGVV